MEEKKPRIKNVLALFMVSLAITLDLSKIALTFLTAYIFGIGGYLAVIVGYSIFVPWLWFSARVNPFNKKNLLSTSVSGILSLIPFIPPITFFVLRNIIITRIEDRIPSTSKLLEKQGKGKEKEEKNKEKRKSERKGALTSQKEARTPVSIDKNAAAPAKKELLASGGKTDKKPDELAEKTTEKAKVQQARKEEPRKIEVKTEPGEPEPEMEKEKAAIKTNKSIQPDDKIVEEEMGGKIETTPTEGDLDWGGEEENNIQQIPNHREQTDPDQLDEVALRNWMERAGNLNKNKTNPLAGPNENDRQTRDRAA